jgi:hypothetical protein
MCIIRKRQMIHNNFASVHIRCLPSPSSSTISTFPQFNPIQIPQTPPLNAITSLTFREKSRRLLYTPPNPTVTPTLQQDFNMCHQIVPVYEACGHRYDAATELSRCPENCTVPKEDLVTQQTTQMCPDCEGDHIPDYSTGEYFKV